MQAPPLQQDQRSRSVHPNTIGSVCGVGESANKVSCFGLFGILRRSSLRTRQVLCYRQCLPAIRMLVLDGRDFCLLAAYDGDRSNDC
jgi:hypothetical protein